MEGAAATGEELRRQSAIWVAQAERQHSAKRRVVEHSEQLAEQQQPQQQKQQQQQHQQQQQQRPSERASQITRLEMRARGAGRRKAERTQVFGVKGQVEDS